MKLITRTWLQRPSMPPAPVQIAHAVGVGRLAVRGLPTYLATAPGGLGREGISVSVDNHKIAGAGAAAANTQFMGDVRGVPPRGRPV